MTKANTEYVRVWRSIPGNKEKQRLQTIARYHTKEGWAVQRLRHLRERAAKKSLEFDLTLDDLQLPDRCPVFGIKLEIGVGSNQRGMAAPNTPSVDRMDSSKGYTKGNVRIISNRANILKSNATLTELKALVRYMEGQ